MEQLEAPLLASDYDALEKQSKRLKKRKDISPGIGSLIECYVDMLRNIRIHAATLELDLTHFMAYAANTEKAAVINLALQRIANEYEDSSLESKLTSVLLGIMALFSADRTSLSEAIAHFDRINFDLTKRFLLYEVSDTEIIQSTILEKAFGVLGLYHRGIALELAGRKDDAYEQYQLIGEFLFQFRQAAFTQSKTIFDFIAGAMYRGSVVLHQLGQPREAAANYRSFLVFHQVTPGTLAGLPVNGTIRLFKALSTYMDLLDRHFRRINFKSLSDDDQFQQLTGRDSGQIWMPESVREESILCSLLLASIDTSLPELKANPVFMEDLSALSHSILRRFARIGYLDGIVKVQKTRFQTTVVDPSMYRNLFHSLLAASKFEEAFLAAQMYLDGRECDRFTLLAIARLCLLFPSKIELVQDILQARLALHILEPWFQVPWLLTHGQYWIQKARTASLTEAHECFAKAKESFTQLAHLDASHAEAFYFLALIEAEANRDLSEAERLVKKSLHLNASDCRSWGLFALIKSARGDYEGALSICNCELANMVVKELRLSLIKVSVLMALTKSDEAIEVLKRMIAAHFRQTGDLRLDGGTTVVSEGTFGPGSFLAKFLGDHGSIYEFETSMLTDQNKLTSFNELTEAFPASVDNYTATKANDGYPIPNEILTPQDLKELSLYRVLKGLGQSPSNVLASLLWLEVAQVYLKESLYADAEAAASQAFKANEVFAPIFAVFGQIDEAQARWTSAIAFYRRGLAIDRDDLGCLLGLSRCLLVASASADSDAAAKLFEAEGMARRAIEIDATIAEAWSLLGQSCLRSGRHEGAGQHFRAAMTLDSVSPLRSYRILPILSE